MSMTTDRRLNYRIHAWCPRCNRTSDTVAPLIPNPRITCYWCHMDTVAPLTVEMKIVAAEQCEASSK